MHFQSPKAYSVPFRALWLQNQDRIELRITLSGRPKKPRVYNFPVTAHLDPMSKRLLGLLLADNKILRLGRWLREHWEELDLDPDDPIPAGTVVYDEGAQYAYFSLWPNLSGETPERAERRHAEVHVDDNGELTRIRLVTSIRRADGLAAAAGYLPTR
jgi:hypothetical protein